MGKPEPTGPETIGSSSMPHLAVQHERLVLELLPFKDGRQFHEWLDSGFVRGSWREFCRDFLAHSGRVPEPDKSRTAGVAKDAINGRNHKYLLYHPDKTGWGPEDHYARFIVTVVQDNRLKGLWSDHDWKKRDLEISKAVYEVLSFLRGRALEVDQNPPSYAA